VGYKLLLIHKSSHTPGPSLIVEYDSNNGLSTCQPSLISGGNKCRNKKNRISSLQLHLWGAAISLLFLESLGIQLIELFPEQLSALRSLEFQSINDVLAKFTLMAGCLE
jgi:hypothetical protein